MFSALEIAKWFLAINNAERNITCVESDEIDVYEGITHLKLQKLLYYAQGIYLVLNNAPLFKEQICAWQHGPVVREVYNEYKRYGKEPINFELDAVSEETINIIENDSAAYTALKLTYDNFAIYTAWQLRNMTHETGSPWTKTITSAGEGCVINNDLIKQYFSENVFSAD